MKTFRAFLKVLSGLILLIAQIILFAACLKVLIIEEFNPRDGLLTFIHITAIGGAIILIRWLLKPEYKSSFTIDPIGGCSYCHRNMSECDCYDEFNEEDEVKFKCYELHTYSRMAQGCINQCRECQEQEESDIKSASQDI